MSRDCLRTGDKATVHFRFIKNPEYLHVGTRMVFREGRTKAIGNITKLLTGVPPINLNKTKMKKMFRQTGLSSINQNQDETNNQENNDSNNINTGNKRTRHRGGAKYRNHFQSTESTSSTLVS